ncbi:MAG: hypothetical protein WBB22_16185 [Anaerolineae bacterium]
MISRVHSAAYYHPAVRPVMPIAKESDRSRAIERIEAGQHADGRDAIAVATCHIHSARLKAVLTRQEG